MLFLKRKKFFIKITRIGMVVMIGIVLTTILDVLPILKIPNDNNIYQVCKTLFANVWNG
jgi:hypothetical protein